MRKIKKNKNLYIHIPFCKNICPYCDFTKLFKNQELEDCYYDNLLFDIENLKDNKYKTVYIGGGTPSSSSLLNIEKLLKAIYSLLYKKHEFTFECNPEDINENLLMLLKKYGVNRISIGIQSFNKKILNLIKRNYDINYFNLIKLVKKYFKNINVDLIYGFKEESFYSFKNNLKKFIKLNVPHISIYALTIYKNTIFYKNNYQIQSDEIFAKKYKYIVRFLRKNGYKRYEVSNFCKKNFESRHNLNYWKCGTYDSIGISASGYIDNIRYKNNSNILKYNKGIREKDEELLTLNDLKTYYLITNLRLEDGFSLNQYKKLFRSDYLLEKENIIKEYKKEGFIKVENGFFKFTDKAFFIMDLLLIKLI